MAQWSDDNKIEELKSAASEKDIPGRTSMNKAELIDALNANDAANSGASSSGGDGMAQNAVGAMQQGTGPDAATGLNATLQADAKLNEPDDTVKSRAGATISDHQMMAAQSTPVAAVPFEVYKQNQYSQAMAEAASLEMDKTVAGGRYRDANGNLVDANGERI